MFASRFRRSLKFGSKALPHSWRRDVARPQASVKPHIEQLEGRLLLYAGALDQSFHYALDWDLLLRFLDAGARFVRLPRFLGAFRLHPEQKTSLQMFHLGRRDVVDTVELGLMVARELLRSCERRYSRSCPRPTRSRFWTSSTPSSRFAGSGVVPSASPGTNRSARFIAVWTTSPDSSNAPTVLYGSRTCCAAPA